MTRQKPRPANRMTRREAMARLGAASLLALGLGPGCHSSRVGAGGRRFRFIVVNDLYHGAPECGPFFNALINQLRTHEDADVVTNRCCSCLRDNHDGTKPEGYWLVTAEASRVARQFIEFPPPEA